VCTVKGAAYAVKRQRGLKASLVLVKAHTGRFRAPHLFRALQRSERPESEQVDRREQQQRPHHHLGALGGRGLVLGLCGAEGGEGRREECIRGEEEEGERSELWARCEVRGGSGGRVEKPGYAPHLCPPPVPAGPCDPGDAGRAASLPFAGAAAAALAPFASLPPGAGEAGWGFPSAMARAL
jgi:hypothetical protein